jgi:hypothetical protein
MITFRNMTKMLEQKDVLLLGNGGISKSGVPFLSAAESTKLVHWTGSRFVCPVCKKHYEPPFLIVALLGGSCISTGNVSDYLKFGGKIIHVSKIQSGCADLDVICS